MLTISFTEPKTCISLGEETSNSSNTEIGKESKDVTVGGDNPLENKGNLSKSSNNMEILKQKEANRIKLLAFDTLTKVIGQDYQKNENNVKQLSVTKSGTFNGNNFEKKNDNLKKINETRKLIKLEVRKINRGNRVCILFPNS